MATQKVDQVLITIEELHPMPSSINRLLRVLEDSRTTAGYIAELISLDQALTASVIRMANSIMLGYDQTCTSLNEAVMRLGFTRVKTLVLGSGVSRSLNRSLPGYRLGAGELWNHSVATAMAAQWLAQAVRYPKPEEAYVAGLLHDMGKMLLDQFVSVDYTEMIKIVEEKRRYLWQVEEDFFGMDHGKVGGLMAFKWEFPPILAEAIEFHHAPSLAFNHEDLPSIVNIADAFSSTLGTDKTDIYGRFVHPEAQRALHLNEAMIEKLRKSITESLLSKAS